ncbi:anti-sigma B factor RsbW [Anaerobacillus alkaliphilus]|uniref:Serine-protein kinase RsbW n=2 Tax=Anaerobacillus alkaliphilus TaxID=1548597 RepID=A0A4Q0VTM9_9BACI|nr:anti-sigma B factor RsbW [Anaerobacillus alkaliphilus]RXJ01956.1 anti-sigma B factor RsbW [Anaerobacillus alkaliphilus]
MNQTSDFLEMKVPAKPEYVGVVRLTISGIANRLGYTYDDIEDIKIAVAEACTNVVNHAYRDGDGQMTIGCGVYQDRLEIMVADRGKSFSVDEIQGSLGPVSADKPISQLKEGGLGLFLIDTLMDKVEISNAAGVIIIMTKFLHRGEVEQNVGRISATFSDRQ